MITRFSLYEGVRDKMTPLPIEEVKERIRKNPTAYLARYKELLSDEEITELIDGMNNREKLDVMLHYLPDYFDNETKKELLKELPTEKYHYILGRFHNIFTKEEIEKYWEEYIMSLFEEAYQNDETLVNLDWIGKKWTKYTKGLEVSDGLYKYKDKFMTIGSVESGDWYLNYLRVVGNANESVRDKMTPKSKGDIETKLADLDIVKRIDFISDNLLFNSYTDEELTEYFKKQSQSDLDMLLVYGVASQRLNVVDILLRMGANPNALDHRGISILSRAATGSITTKPSLEIIKMLLDYGADPLRPSGKFGSIPLNHAKVWNKDVYELMKPYAEVKESVRNRMTPKSSDVISRSVMDNILSNYTDHTMYLSNRDGFGLEKLKLSHHTGDGFMNSVRKRFGSGVYLHVADEDGDIARKYLYNLGVNYTPVMSTTFKVLDGDKMERVIRKFMDEVLGDKISMLMIRKFDK